jgi:hypothetical protein
VAPQDRDTRLAGLLAAKRVAAIEKATYEPNSPPWRACRKIIMDLDVLMHENRKAAIVRRGKRDRDA